MPDAHDRRPVNLNGVAEIVTDDLDQLLAVLPPHICDPLQELQARRVIREQDRLGAPGDEDLLDALRERDHGDARQIELVHRGECRRQLTLAAVDHDDVRQRGEARVVLLVVLGEVDLRLPALVAALEHLGHRGEVIGHAVVRAPDPEAPVVGLLRGAALEHDHRGDGVGRAEVGDVEALDAHRQRVEAERIAKLVQRIDALLAPSLRAQLVLL